MTMTMRNGFLSGQVLSTAILLCFYFGNTSFGLPSGTNFGVRAPSHAGQYFPCHQSGISEHRRHKKTGFSSFAHSAPHEETMIPIVYTATVDCSAANEYIRAHYNQSQYFRSKNLDSSMKQSIHDGRILQSCYDNDRELLIDHGLVTIRSPITKEPNWSELTDIQNFYLPELERIVHKLFPSKLENYCFWNPMLRGESYEISREEGSRAVKTPTANIASLVHIDTDVGAYESIQEFLGIVQKNQVQSPNSPDKNAFKNVAEEIVHGSKRFAVVNFWRNIGDTPVTSAPIAMLSTIYDEEHSAFPDVRPNMQKSKWFVFPNATRDEVIVFYQYDRNLKQPSDLWHCAISTQTSERKLRDVESSTRRKSFDIRALIVLDEVVPDELDRFSHDRTRPLLTLEESGCFCDDQAAIRNKDKSYDSTVNRIS